MVSRFEERAKVKSEDSRFAQRQKPAQPKKPRKLSAPERLAGQGAAEFFAQRIGQIPQLAEISEQMTPFIETLEELARPEFLSDAGLEPGGEKGLRNLINLIAKIPGLKKATPQSLMERFKETTGGQFEPQSALERIALRPIELLGMIQGLGGGGGAAPFALGGIPGQSLREIGVDEPYPSIAEILFGAGSKASEPLFKKVISEGKDIFGEGAGAIARRETGFPPPPGGGGGIVRQAPVEEAAMEEIFGREQRLAEEAAERANQEALRKFQEDVPASRLRGRVTAEGEDIGVRPTALGESQRSLPRMTPQARDTFLETGRAVHPTRYPSEHTGGTQQIRAVQNLSQELRTELRQSYDTAREAYEGISDVYPKLVDNLQQFRNRILAGRQLNELNSAERTVVNSVDNFLRESVTEDGDLIARPVSSLISTADSWASLLNQEEIFGNVKTLLREFIPQLNEAALGAVESAGENPALLRIADEQYANWARRFGNDDIAPYLKREIRNPEELFRNSIKDEGKYRALEQALEGTPLFDEIIPVTSRHVAEQRMLPFINDLTKVGSRPYQQALRDLEPLIGEEATRRLHNEMRRLQTLKPKKLEIPPAAELAKKSPILKQAEKVTKIPQERLRSMMNETSTIKELERMLSDTPEQKQLFDKLKAFKIHNMASQGKVKGEMTGKSAFETLNKRKNFEIMAELYGEDQAVKMLETFEKIGKKELTRQNLGKFGQHLIGIKILKHLLPLF